MKHGKKGKRRLHGRDFTTGDVARICGVASRTVSKWCDTGALKNYRLPSTGPSDSRDRRIIPRDLLRFVRDNRMVGPERILLSEIRSVLIFGAGVDRIVELLQSIDPEVQSGCYPGLVEAGLDGAFTPIPPVIIFDDPLERGNGVSAAQEVIKYLKRTDTESSLLVGISQSADAIKVWRQLPEITPLSPGGMAAKRSEMLEVLRRAGLVE